jgi:hypothetical protein
MLDRRAGGLQQLDDRIDGDDAGRGCDQPLARGIPSTVIGTN